MLREKDVSDRRMLLGELYENLLVTDRITRPCLRFPFTLLSHVEELRSAFSGGDENRLPPPSIVLSRRKNARPRSRRERALHAWCSRLYEVRTHIRAQLTSGVVRIGRDCPNSALPRNDGLDDTPLLAA